MTHSLSLSPLDQVDYNGLTEKMLFLLKSVELWGTLTARLTDGPPAKETLAPLGISDVEKG